MDNHDDTLTDGGIATFIRGCSLPSEILRAIKHYLKGTRDEAFYVVTDSTKQSLRRNFMFC